jgi:hypothetical protein
MSDSLTHSLTDSVLKTNKQTNKQGRIFKGFWFNCSDERHMRILDMSKELLKIDPTKGFTGIILDALEEFGRRHLPSGNNQLKLGVFTTENIPLCKAAKEKLEPKPTVRETPKYADMTTETLTALFSHPWKLEGYDRQLVAHILKTFRGVDLEKIKKDLK